MDPEASYITLSSTSHEKIWYDALYTWHYIPDLQALSDEQEREKEEAYNFETHGASTIMLYKRNSRFEGGRTSWLMRHASAKR